MSAQLERRGSHERTEAMDFPGTKRRDWRLAWALAAAYVLILFALGDMRGFWLDEYYTLRAGQMGWASMARDRLAAGHSPLYFAYAKLFVFIPGATERVLRLSSAFAGGALILALTLLARRCGLRRYLPAIWAFALVLPYWLDAGMLFRYMMPGMVVAVLATWATFRYSRQPSLKAGMVLGAFMALLPWTHHTLVILAAGLILFLLLDAPWRPRSWRRTLAGRLWPAAVLVGAWVPLYLLTRGNAETFTPSTLGLEDRLWLLIEAVFGDLKFWGDSFGFRPSRLYDIAIGLLVACAWLARRELLRRGLVSAWRLIVALVAACVLAAIFGPPALNMMLRSRYVMVFSIPAVFCMALAWHHLVALGAARCATRLAAWAFCAVLALFMGMQTVGAVADPGDGHREAVRWVMDHRLPEDPLLYSLVRPTNRALAMHGMEARLFPMPYEQRNVEELAKEIRLVMRGQQCGFLIHYFSRSRLLAALDHLQEEGFIDSVRAWQLNAKTHVAVFILDPSQRQWLQQIDPPRMRLLPVTEHWQPGGKRRE